MIPKLAFIVPYRNRAYNLNVFNVMMKHLMEDHEPGFYEVFVAHQCDNRPFNRGAMKNIGFLAVKQKYPEHYQQMTIVFNDVDTVPTRKGLLNYETTNGTIKHFYGFNFALGGIFSITGADFEKLNGFPNYWSWGYEDNVIHKRAEKVGLRIDRSVFYPLGHPAILQIVDGYIKNLNRNHKQEMASDNFRDGVATIQNVRFSYEVNTNTFVNISSFEPIHRIEDEELSDYNFVEKKYLDGNGRHSNMTSMRSSRYNTPTQPVARPNQPMLLMSRSKLLRRSGSFSLPK